MICDSVPINGAAGHTVHGALGRVAHEDTASHEWLSRTSEEPNPSDTILERNGDYAPSTPSTNTNTTTTANFNSNFLNQEYMMLGDLISKPSSPSAEDFATAAPHDIMGPEFLLEFNTNIATRPFISLQNFSESELLQNSQLINFSRAYDQNEYVSPLISQRIYKTVQDIYSNQVINFDYPLSYHSLTKFLRERFPLKEKGKKTSDLLTILKLIASYRPTFISAHKSLFKPFDFDFLEMSFQRCLLDYESLSELNASPTIIWRRTGEIVSISNDLVRLLGLNISSILSKRTFIVELMHDDESIVEYFRLFKSVAVGNLHSSISTKLKLIKKTAESSPTGHGDSFSDVGYIEFCCVWTVKRDLFDLPMMIVGQFLPMLSNGVA